MGLSSYEQKTIVRELEQKYSRFLMGRKITLVPKLNNKTVLVTMTLASPDLSFYYPIESYLDYENEKLDKKEAMKFLIDYIDLYLEEYFDEEEDLFLPLDWSKFSYEDKVFYMKGQKRNLKLEQEADKLLS